MKRVLILALDTFASKNCMQIELLNEFGYVYDVLTNDKLGNSKQIFQPFTQKNELHINCKPFGDKIAKFLKLVLSRRYHHVELYPGGRLSVVYSVILKLLNVKLFIIERGDISYINKYDTLTSFSMKLSYKLADKVIYKEPYMLDILTKLGAKNVDFLPNCIKATSYVHSPAVVLKDQKHFLWANRIIKERRARWVVNAFKHNTLHNHRLTVLGFKASCNDSSNLTESEREIMKNQMENVSLLPFQDPNPYYAKSHFFLFIGDLIFGNNALLEAMSCGLIPIVNKAPNVEMIVEDGIDGIVVDYTEQDCLNGIQRAVSLSNEEISIMSKRARQKVQEKFSCQTWREKLITIYMSAN